MAPVKTKTLLWSIFFTNKVLLLLSYLICITRGPLKVWADFPLCINIIFTKNP